MVYRDQGLTNYVTSPRFDGATTKLLKTEPSSVLKS
jgi:hypothetical protein